MVRRHPRIDRASADVRGGGHVSLTLLSSMEYRHKPCCTNQGKSLCGQPLPIPPTVIMSNDCVLNQLTPTCSVCHLIDEVQRGVCSLNGQLCPHRNA